MANVDPAYGLGLLPDSIRLVRYNPLWPRAFAEEAARLQEAIGSAAIAIEHYGSTSVPGLRAKPILDIQIGVERIEVADQFVEAFAHLGYEHLEHGLPEHRLFGRSMPRTHLVHVVVYGSDQWSRSIRFRDRLRADPAIRASYEALKDRLVASVATRDEYTAGKSEFVHRCSA